MKRGTVDTSVVVKTQSTGPYYFFI